MTCAVAPRREAGLPYTTSPPAEWGTACHKVLENALLAEQRPYPEHARPIWDALAPDVQRVGDFGEMAECAAVAYDYATQRQRDLAPAALRAETKLDAGVLIAHDNCWGTADTVIVSQDELEVIDLKSGSGVLVEPDDPQLRIYALGALGQYGFAAAPFKVIKLTIVQPRAKHVDGPIRSIILTKDELLAWGYADFAQAVARTEDPNAVATPTEDGCRWCKAKATCPELSQLSLNAAQAVFSEIPGAMTPTGPSGREELAEKLTRAPEALTPEELRYIMDHEKLITGWLSAVRNYAKEQGMAGHRIPGYKIVAGRNTRNWAEEEEAVIKATTNLKTKEGKRLGKMALIESKLMSPAQAEKRVKPLLPEKTWEKVSSLIKSSGGSPTLAPETDSRPALLTAASDVFKPIGTGDGVSTSFEIPEAETPSELDLDFLN